MMKTEKVIENEILTYLNAMPGMFAWKNNTVGIYDPIKKVYRKSNSKFIHNGVPDILAVCNGLLLAIEVKTSKGVVSKDQKRFIEHLNEQGALTLVARSLSDVRTWFKEKRDKLYGYNQTKGLSREV